MKALRISIQGVAARPALHTSMESASHNDTMYLFMDPVLPMRE